MLKFADTAAPMADFPVAMAEHIEFTDGENLQQKLDDGTLGGAGSDNNLTDDLKAQYDEAYAKALCI